MESILPTGPLSGAVGGAVKFSTKLEPATRPFITVGWSFNEVNFITYTSTGRDFVDPLYANRVTVDRTTGSMELRGLALVDSGEYALSITTDEGQQKIGTIVLNVYGKVVVLTLAWQRVRVHHGGGHVIVWVMWRIIIPVSSIPLVKHSE